MDPESGQQPPSRAANMMSDMTRKATQAAINYATKAATGMATGGVGTALLYMKDAIEDPDAMGRKVAYIAGGILFFILIFFLIIIVVISGGKGSGAPGNNATGSASTSPVASGSAQPSEDTCKGKYTMYMLKNPYDKTNYGDPECNFTREEAKGILEQAFPAKTAQLFYDVMRKESSYIAVNWTNSVGDVKTPNNFGAWGLYQMGSSFKKNNQYDNGQAHWIQQMDNAMNYLRLLKGCGGKYWEAWRSLVGKDTCYPLQ